jgi:hypothetical protein
MSKRTTAAVGLLIALVLPAPSTWSAEVRIVLKNGAIVTGAKVSENLNFLVVDVDGSQISLYKEMIQSVRELDSEPESSAASPAAKAAVTPAEAPPETPERDTAEKPKAPRTTEKPAVGRATEPRSAAAPPVPRPAFDQLLRRPSSVTVMDLSFMDLDRLSPKISLFTRLRRLDLKGNSLETLPPEIGDLTQLEELDLRLNRIDHLPPQIMNLTGLRYLYVTANRLSREDMALLKQRLPFTTIVSSPTEVVRDRKTRPTPLSPGELGRADTLDIQCRAGNTTACRDLGHLFAEHRDYERALIAYQGGCDLGSSEHSPPARISCTEAGDIFNYIFKNRDRAVQYYEHVCKHIGDGTGTVCERLHTALRRR